MFLAFRQEPVSCAPELAKWVDGKIKSPQDGLIKAFGQGFVESPIRRACQTERVAGWDRIPKLDANELCGVRAAVTDRENFLLESDDVGLVDNNLARPHAGKMKLARTQTGHHGHVRAPIIASGDCCCRSDRDQRA